MADAQVSPRDLLRDLFGRPKFRSRREKVGYYVCACAVLMPMALSGPAARPAAQ